ncbi:hypothetical protein [Mycolicibacillus trivialis]|nr:hypothetical protein [Mycolicibacillus trivialis]
MTTRRSGAPETRTCYKANRHPTPARTHLTGQTVTIADRLASGKGKIPRF